MLYQPSAIWTMRFSNFRKFSVRGRTNWNVFRGEETWNYVIIVTVETIKWMCLLQNREKIRGGMVFIFTHLKECHINKRLSFGLAEVCKT